MQRNRPFILGVVLVLTASLSACSGIRPDEELRTELGSQLQTLESSFETAMRTTAIAEWGQTLLDPRGGVVGERWTPSTSEADQLNVAGGITLYAIQQSGDSITFDALLSTSVDTGSGMLYKRLGAYICVELGAYYEPGKVAVQVDDADCAPELESRLAGDTRYRLHDLPGWG
jgi:hypothetical protein